MNNKKRKEIYSIFARQHPNPKTELIYNSSFELLIAVILSAQTTDIAVNKVTIKLFRNNKTPSDFVKLGEKKLQEKIKTIGLFRNKAKNIISTCKILVDEHKSEIPKNRALLQKLPGVGRKTANVVLNTAFGHPTMAVDTHIFRVSNRTKIAPGKNVLEVEKRLVRLIPKEFLVDAHHWLILLGRYTCVARKPRCGACLIEDLCEFKQKTSD